MSPEPFLPLLVFAAASTFSPGGATVLAMASGAHFGYWRSLPLIAGISLALGMVAAAAAAGIGTILFAVPALETAVKAIGSAYLVWIAWRLARSGPPSLTAGTNRPLSLVGAAWLLIHNTKAWVMATGAAASFAMLADGPAELAVLLAAVFAVSGAVSLSLWCLLGRTLARFLRRAWQWRLVNLALAALLVASLVPMWQD